MKKKIFGSILAASLLALAVAGCGTAPASNGSAGSTPAPAKEEPKYPTKQIEIIVPFAAGGGTDIFARAMSDYLSKEWGQPVIVVNKPGAGGATGTQAVLKQGSKDGYSVVTQSVSAVTGLLAGVPNLPFKYEDYQFISRNTNDPLAFVVKSDAPWNSIEELNDWVKQNPDKLTFASNGPTAIATFGVIQWLDSIGGDFSKAKLIVTNGAGDALPKVAGGHITLGVQGVSEVSNLVKAGKLKILAVASPERSPFFPDAPTLEEKGVKNITASFWVGVSMPAGVPDHVVKKWETTLEKMHKDSAFQEKLKSMSVQGSYQNPTEYANYVKEELALFSEMVKAKGLIK
ncbi:MULTISPECIES: tripartite tricarboxylate transporter substrate binding protein [unclassified Paenibacillus]|uniref:tripartite tricarboxylate transporter substrate binding protein n=1 Tax=unclassified Paenibacillus TaxID=185978 RepID=UPI001AE7DF52|nr:MULTISPECIES: tripartite tricarboxylate transporter substrate binding protein [unclassified Paenibacillus]MBP1155649.1 tripartite-type tricarboxylate transporter receptor subunit TctC [Paenibacillus sp. PvP091]MBP1168965.1 tripartite-type tricarboxylate transporter receptor subunit TctC [Paenibacillus sp. PvR098]MBP2439993.1 tripartite-type tricarboxylate transporter receptor subunit TctC [Paenibacillus sp. PvP052]